MAADTSTRPVYSAEQVEQYLDYVGIPTNERIKPEVVDSSAGLSFLQKLIRYQLCRVPFENLDLHYSVHKAISLDVDHLFNKIVERKAGRGGYCMQNNMFFATILRSLGYSVMTTGGRVSSAMDPRFDPKKTPLEKAPYGSIGHQVNIVSIEGKKYFCDVGFGSTGPTFPVPLEDGHLAVNTGDKETTATQMLLRRGFMPNSTHRNPEQLVWIYSVRHGTSEEVLWTPCYCFTETEFLPGDFEVMNWYVSMNRKSMFTNRILCQKFLMDEEENMIGDVTLFETSMKERRLGNSEQLVDIRCEDDRVNALEKHMGLILNRQERNGILGLYSMVPDTR